MRFASPSWLWALALLPPLYLMFRSEMDRRRKLLEGFAGPALWKALIPGYDPRARPRKMRAWMAAAVLLILAAARPQWGFQEETVTVSGLDIVVAFDVSNSMMVEDVVPSRLKKAKHLVRTLMDRLAGDRVGIVAFAGSSFLASPLTTDISYLEEVLDTLEPESVANQGTDLGGAIDTSLKALQRGAEDLSQGGQGAMPSKVLVLITDGEDLEGRGASMVSQLKEAGIELFVVGVGTEKGGPVPVRDSSGVLRGFKHSDSGSAVVSALDRGGLQSLASSGGGKYFDATEEESEIDAMMQSIGALDRKEFAERRYLIYQERYQVPLFLAVVILLLELSLPVRSIAAGAAVLLALALSTAAKAEPLGIYLENEKGKKAYSDGNVDEARKHFGAAQAREPDNPDLLFNQSLVQLQEGNAAAAAQGFEEAAKSAFQRGDESLAARSLYNLGVSRMKNNDFSGAADAFSRSISLAQRNGDGKLENDGRKKLLKMASQSQQQKQQQQQQGGQGQDKDQQQQQGGEGQEQKQDEKGQGDKNQPKQYSRGNPNKKFKSEKLSKEDAERVMAELSENEKALQARLRKQQGRQQRTDKDW